MPAPKEPTSPKPKILLLVLIILAEIFAIAWILSRGRTPPPTDLQQLTTNNQQLKATLSLSPSSGTLQVGDSQTLTIKLSALGQKLNGADVIISYLPHLATISDQNPELEGTQIAPTELFPLYPINRVDSQTGKIYLSALVQSPPAEPVQRKEASPILAEFTFTARTPGTVKFDFLFDPARTDTSSLIQSGTSQNLLSQTTGATFTIVK